ncbi:hypothetical protein RM549_02180 [Salegentibacter sp. F188]|uniref:Uncharacterized protein n=1 Tax=Autumnicola patrickiae TaxID=3075591 RepID=A0ABU3DZT5_9FLAO|nr:hypothetical protein [Salegentibacter sp. F188]MDT0688572.1 hypothetical protein [Salegentibacter sp. F188]
MANIDLQSGKFLKKVTSEMPIIELQNVKKSAIYIIHYTNYTVPKFPNYQLSIIKNSLRKANFKNGNYRLYNLNASEKYDLKNGNYRPPLA